MQRSTAPSAAAAAASSSEAAQIIAGRVACGLAMPSIRPVLLRCVLALVALAATAGCTSLPPLPARAATHAFADADTAATKLGAIERASLAGAAKGASGFRLLPTGDHALDARLALVERAERSVDAQYYQLQRDGVGLAFLAGLRDAAARGVRVRLLVDDLYTTGEDELFATFAALPGVEVRLFNPLPARGGSLLGRLVLSLHDFGRINHRMHNKLLVADNRFAVSGGRNLADEYFMRSAAANFIDMDVISAGPIVREQSAVFDRFWNSAYAYPVESVVDLPLDRAAARRRFEEALGAGRKPEREPAASDVLGGAAVGFELASGRVQLVPASARVFADAPEKVDTRGRDDGVTTVNRSVLDVMAEARSEVIIASPYFIPGEFGLERMKDGIDHGVSIVVLTNSLGATDAPLVHWRYARYRKAMLRLGVKLFELGPELAQKSGGFGDFGASLGRLHAKVAVIDRRLLFVGSMNLDARSAWSNTEAGLLIDSPRLSEAIYALVGRDRNESVYRLRLAADGESIQWVTTAADGKETVLDDEPHSDWLLRLKLRLLEPFASEDLL